MRIESLKTTFLHHPEIGERFYKDFQAKNPETGQLRGIHKKASTILLLRSKDYEFMEQYVRALINEINPDYASQNEIGVRKAGFLLVKFWVHGSEIPFNEDVEIQKLRDIIVTHVPNIQEQTAAYNNRRAEKKK